MAWNTQPRTLEVVSDAFPKYHDTPIFVAARLRGVEKLGRLYAYEVDVTTIEAVHFTEVPRYVDVNKLVGKRMTVKIACEGNGTWADGGAVNTGAAVREISGVIAGVKCLGADERRVTWRLRLRPSLWLLTLNRENRAFLDKDVIEITREVLADYPVMVRYRVDGPGYGRKSYPKRDYVRQWYESDWDFLNRLWQQWGITFFYDKDTLVLFDGASWKKHGAAYRTIRYLDRGGQRIDEEHIHKLELSRALTTGKVTVTDYDYTWGEANLNRTIQIHRAASNDNAEEYIQADYAQPLQGGMGLHGDRNDWEFEADHLARMRAEAHRCRSLRIKGKGNLRGLKTGFSFYLEGFPYAPANMEYVVTGTEIEIVNNDTVTQSGRPQREYTCRTRFTAQDANEVYRTPLKATKPSAFAETAIVTGYDKDIICTDQMARLKLWMTWDRRGKRDGRATCWVPLSQMWQGNRYGAVWIPRVDDHVHVGYVNEDPDRPFVLASHTTNDNTTPWDLPGQGNDALSGWRSQDIGGKSIASNSVVTDDTPGKLQVQVASDQANSRFVAGFNTRIEGNKGRTVARGEGIEIATDAHGVWRANRGLLATTETRAGASAPMKDMGETVARLTQARQQHEELSQLAQKHNAQTTGSSQADVTADMKTQNDAIKGGQKTADNPSPEMTRPDMVLASAAGIATTATDSTHMASWHDHAITVGRDYSLSAGRSMYASVAGSISLFAYRDGMRFVSANGPVQIQAQGGPMSFKALGDLEITSSEGRIIINAKRELWLGADGSFIQLNGSGIINGSPGPILEKGANWKKAEAATMYPRLTAFATHPITFNCDEMAALDQGAVVVPAAPAPSKLTDPPARQGGGTTTPNAAASTKSSSESGTVGQDCTWQLQDISDLNKDLDVESTNYWTVNKDGSPYYLPGSTQQYFVRYDGYKGRANVVYKSEDKRITATVRILIVPMVVKETAPDGSEVDAAFNHDKDAFPGTFPQRKLIQRDMTDEQKIYLIAALETQKKKIEGELNSNGYHLTVRDCSKGAVCRCKIPVTYVVEFVLSEESGAVHKIINLFPTSYRANAANWGEKTVSSDNLGKDPKLPAAFEHVHTHEVGHLFGFPDEYYWGGGAIHRDYIDEQGKLKLGLAKNNPRKDIWQGTSPDSLMGDGVYGWAKPAIPPYYLSHVVKWFGEKTGRAWRVAT